MHGVVHRQYLHRALGALGQSIIKIINRSTNFINELLYMHFVTRADPNQKLTDYTTALHRAYCAFWAAEGGGPR